MQGFKEFLFKITIFWSLLRCIKGGLYKKVKSGTKGSMQSMRLFLQQKNLNIGIRTSLENFSKLPDALIIPLYAIGNIVGQY